MGSGIKANLKTTIKTEKATRFEAHLSRAFRKFHFKAMGKAQIEPIHKHALTGHKNGISNIEASSLAMTYDSPEETELFESYCKAVPYLTIDQSAKLNSQV